MVYVQEIDLKPLLFAVIWKTGGWRKSRIWAIQIRTASWIGLYLLGQFKFTGIQEIHTMPLRFNVSTA